MTMLQGDVKPAEEDGECKENRGAEPARVSARSPYLVAVKILQKWKL